VDYTDYINDILDSINLAIEFTKNLEYDDFAQDKKTILAVIRCLEVIGEASKKITPEIKNHFQEVPWKRMTGMRDKLIHDYFGVDLEKIWLTVKKDLPPLHEKLRIIKTKDL
jgi:uncharacterized protein with HEPN domain